MQHALSHELVIVAVQQPADEEKVGLERVAERAKLAEEILIQAVGHVKAQPVDIELVYPKPDAAEDMLYDRGVFQVELDQLIVSLPALVPETVVIARIAIE